MVLVVTDLLSILINPIMRVVNDDVLGTTRDHFEDKKVISLEYECYKPMAIREIRKICVQVKEKWPSVARVYVIHRVGYVILELSSL